MKKRSTFFVLVMVFSIILFTSSVSLAVEINNIMFDDVNKISDYSKSYISSKNVVDIIIEFDGDVISAKIGDLDDTDERVTLEVGKVTFEDYILKNGVNSLTVELIDEDNESAKQNIKIDYSGSFLISGSEYKGDIPSDGELSVFEDDVKLTFAKGNYIVDEDGETIDNNLISFEVIKSDNEEEDLIYSQPISNWVGVYSDDVDGDNFAYPGTISLKYTEDSIELSPSLITVLFKKQGDLSWDNISAVVDPKKKIATTAFQGFGDYGVFLRSRNFADFNWSRPFAEPLWAKGIMKTRNNDDAVVNESVIGAVYLGLSNPCKRADYAGMIVKGLGLTPVDGTNAEKRFDDLKVDLDGDGVEESDHPYKQEILTAAAYGIMEGGTDGKFNPDDNLTREQAAVVVARVSNLTLILDQDKVDSALSKIFKDTADYDLISDWARPYVLACVKAKIIVGDAQGKFNAQDPLTRDAAAKFVYNIMKEKKRI